MSLPIASHIDYDAMSEEDYYKEMEKKVEFYKKQYPDMYDKAVQWMAMLNDSEIYKENVPNDPNNRIAAQQKAMDIMKNALYQGWTEHDMDEKDAEVLTKWISDWKEQLQKNVD